MILHVEYDTEDYNRIISCNLCENIILKNDSETSTIRHGYVRINASNANIAKETMNNPRARCFNKTEDKQTGDPDASYPIGTIGALTGSIDPYARKLTGFSSDIRPAAYRAGTTSFFKNL